MKTESTVDNKYPKKTVPSNAISPRKVMVYFTTLKQIGYKGNKQALDFLVCFSFKGKGTVVHWRTLYAYSMLGSLYMVYHLGSQRCQEGSIILIL